MKALSLSSIFKVIDGALKTCVRRTDRHLLMDFRGKIPKSSLTAIKSLWIGETFVRLPLLLQKAAEAQIFTTLRRSRASSLRPAM